MLGGSGVLPGVTSTGRTGQKHTSSQASAKKGAGKKKQANQLLLQASMGAQRVTTLAEPTGAALASGSGTTTTLASGQ